MTRALGLLALILCAAPVSPVSAESVLVRRFDRKENARLHPPPYSVSEGARELHGTLRVVDLHSDALLWDRDLLARNDVGHVDVPRLIEGGATLQVFSIVTHAPRGINIHRNDAKQGDLVTALAVASGWPRKTWRSRLQRALYQAGRFSEQASRSGGALVQVRTREDLAAHLKGRKGGTVAGVLAVEGAQALDGRLENVDVLFDAGVRMMSPTHFVDTELGGSAHGTSHGGLTEFGRKVLTRMEERGMIVDLAHASPKLIDDALNAAKRPLVVSHTGVYATCPNQRNLTDDQLKRVAVNGGLVGIGYWKTATCGEDADALARAVKHAVQVMGVAHVALGSDFDGAVAEPFDAAGLPLVTQALKKQGFSDADVRAIMGENALKFLAKNLPSR